MVKKHAVLVGMNYKKLGSSWELFGCINDALMIQNMLIDAYGFKNEDITLLKDDVESKTNWPTKNNVINALTREVNELGKNDTLWIHISSHGDYFDDYGTNETDNRDELVLVYNNNQNGVTYILDDEFNNIIKRAKCKVISVVDACNSGTICDLPYNFKHEININNIDRQQNIIKQSIENNLVFENKNIFSFGSARDIELASDSFNNKNGLSMGAFTIAFIECLRNNNHSCSFLKLYNDICVWLKENDYEQRPQFTSSNETGIGYLNKHDTILEIDDIIQREKSSSIIIEYIKPPRKNNNVQPIAPINKNANVFKMSFI
jgi:hypothetical protein